jgi:hypothetical protein
LAADGEHGVADSFAFEAAGAHAPEQAIFGIGFEAAGRWAEAWP